MKTPRYRVLVVDDDPVIRSLLTNILSLKGHVCEAASDGVEALDKVNAKSFDAVITDVTMPHMNGIALTKELLKRYPGLPVLVMTAFIDIHSDEEAINAGAVDFIKKPFSLVEFISRFHKMMHNNETYRKLLGYQKEFEKVNAKIMEDLEKESGEDSEPLKKELEELREIIKNAETQNR